MWLIFPIPSTGGEKQGIPFFGRSSVWQATIRFSALSINIAQTSARSPIPSTGGEKEGIPFSGQSRVWQATIRLPALSTNIAQNISAKTQQGRRHKSARRLRTREPVAVTEEISGDQLSFRARAERRQVAGKRSEKKKRRHNRHKFHLCPSRPLRRLIRVAQAKQASG